MIETLKDIWQGWLQFGVGDTTRWLYFSFDVLLVALILYFIIRAFNSQKNISYLALIGLALALLVITAYLTLPGVHLVSQFGIVLLLVGLPFFLDDKWLGLFSQKVQLATPARPFLHPLLTGLLSLVGAFIIVGLASGIGAKTAELPSGVPLLAVNLPDGMAASFGSQVTVRIIVSAENSKWRSLTADNFSATVDVAKQGIGTYDLPIKLTSEVGEVTIIRVSPSRVVVTVEPIIKKTVTVVAKFSGRAGDELVPDEPIFEPFKVEARGPKSILSDLTQAFVQIRLNGETQKIVQKYSLVALTSSGEVISSVLFDPTEVETTINFVAAGNLKTVGIRPVTSGQPSSGYWIKSITLEPAVATVTGPADQLTALAELTTEPISVAGLNTDTTVQTTPSLPSGITIADGTTKITAKVDLELVSTIKTVQPEIEYSGLSSALKVTSVVPASIPTIVAGPSSVLNTLADGTVKLKLNLSPYQSAGTYSLTIRNSDFTLPDSVSLVSFLPSAVNVVLESK